MADTYTSSLRIVQQEVGANENTWGTINNAALAMLEQGVAGWVAVSLTAGNVTLATNNNADDEARNAIINLTGTPGTTRTVTFPTVEKSYWIINNSDSTATLTTGSGATVSLPSNVSAKIYCDGSAGISALRYSFRGAMVKKSADQTTADYTAGPAMAFNSEIYDTGVWHDNSVANTRLTVPAGVTAVRVGGNVIIADTTVDTFKTLVLTKNGSASFDGACGVSLEVGATSCGMSIASGVIAVTAGDYFELVLTEESDNSVTITAARTNFWIEAVQ